MKALQDMSKMELEAYARKEFGVELNRASSKENLIKEIQAMEHGDKQVPIEDENKMPPKKEEAVVHSGFSGEEVPPEEVPASQSLKPGKKAKPAKLSGFDKVLKDMQVAANDASMKEPHHPDCHSHGTNPQCDYCDPSLPGADDLFSGE